MGATRADTGKRAGLNRQTIVEVAVRMSAQRGIDGWSMRTLAAELGVVPSVLYHYFPSKDELCDGVVERISADLVIPSPALDWKDWFRQMLANMRPILVEYHGVTERLKQGKFTPALLPVVETGVAKLREAGFGENTALAYTMLFNVAISTISAHNLRTPGRPAPHHDMQAMIARMDRLGGDSPGVNYLVEHMFLPILRDSESVSRDYYTKVIDAIIDGLEHTLMPPNVT